MTDMVEKPVRVGVLIPEEGRMIAADIFNREQRHISDDWVKYCENRGCTNQLQDL